MDTNLARLDEVLTKDQNILKASVIDENKSLNSQSRHTESDVLEIFVRINRQGTQLSRSDLIFSMLKLHWKESATALPDFVKKINEGNSFQKVAWLVDDHIRRCGFENCHRKHIGAVLGHRVTKADSTRLSMWSYKGLAVKQVSWFLFRSLLARAGLHNLTPNWNHTRICQGVAAHGLWAVEPHLALEGVGVKFEEILVIDGDGARWLDDELPHHLRSSRRREANVA